MCADTTTSELITQRLFRMAERFPPERATELLYYVLLGRPPDNTGAEYYSTRMRNSTDDYLSVINELSQSTEAKDYGLFNTLETTAGPLGLSKLEIIDDPMVSLAVIGTIQRRVIESIERLSRIEEVVRLTLLTVPEISGQALESVSDRVSRIEATLKR